TPLWRNGPPEKPVLCNACGSRWRTKGSLANYTPLHSRGEPAALPQSKTPKLKYVLGKAKDQKLHMQKLDEVSQESEDATSDYDPQSEKLLEEESSNRSSSGSAISYSESCTQFGSTDASDFTGSSQSIVWDSLVPSKRRTCLSRSKPKPSPVEKLTKDLYSILHEQELSYPSGSTEEDLIFENEKPMVSVEIGHGGVLIKHPHSTAQDEESEASSLVIQNKGYSVSESYSMSSSVPVHTQRKGINSSEVNNEKMKHNMSQGTYDHTKRDKVPSDRFHFLQSSSSPLQFIDLEAVVNYEKFMEYFSHEEQQQLINHLSSVDNCQNPDSIRNAFDSPSFKEALYVYQRLLSNGIFDLSFQGIDIESCKAIKILVLCETIKSRWVEQYAQLKNSSETIGKDKSLSRGNIKFSKSISMKRPHDYDLSQKNTEPKHKIRAVSRSQKCAPMDMTDAKLQAYSYAKHGQSTCEANESLKYDASCFSPRSLFASPPGRSPVTMDSLQFTDNSSEQDLLLDVPSNMSLHQAELLDCNFWKQKSSPTGSLIETPNK
ncbi:GATA transcription factor 26, partial [Nymphaea thermarum]